MSAASCSFYVPVHQGFLLYSRLAAALGTASPSGRTYDLITLDFGNHVLDGGAGVVTLVGGAGNATYEVDNASDVVTEASGEGTDTVNSSVSYTISDADVENLTLTGSSNINGMGNASANMLTGYSGDDLLDVVQTTQSLEGLDKMKSSIHRSRVET